jgi:hypothetical protein
MDIWNIYDIFGIFKVIWYNLLTIGVLRAFGILCGHFGCFGKLCQEKSGNPDAG